MMEQYANPFNSKPGSVLESRFYAEGVPKLFEPLKIRETTFKNRAVVSPMCMYSSIDGHANAFHLAHLGQFAFNGVGLVIMEATGVTPEGRITARDHGLYLDEHIPMLKTICDLYHSTGSKIGIQLGHSGRKGSTYPPFVGRGHNEAVPVNVSDEASNPKTAEKCKGYQTIAPSAIKWSEDLQMPREMTKEDISRVIKAFGEATARAEKAGFDVIEIHAAHGYLIHQFLSPISNNRTDEYGGSFENRTRFLLEICREIRRNFPETKPVFIRFSCTDWIDGGWSLDDTIKISAVLQNQKLCDLADCSAGGLLPSQIIPKIGPGYQVPYAKAVRDGVPGMLTGAVGFIIDPKLAERILQEGSADMIFMAREFLRNPAWLYRAANELNINDFVERLPQYKRTQEKVAVTFSTVSIQK